MQDKKNVKTRPGQKKKWRQVVRRKKWRDVTRDKKQNGEARREAKKMG